MAFSHDSGSSAAPLSAGASPYGWRRRPERIVLAPRPGRLPSTSAPVRIFVGTEPGQYRIERVFVWSIEQVRDPARRYEIYLMRELAGFDQRRWLTGFTNYRFAIPYFAGGSGRAIYNDCDQIYLRDPAELFDLDMGEHGFLSINDHDTSVMLIDCAKMDSVWSLAEARSGKRKQIEAKARAVPGLWGPADAGWNSRDEEYDPATSKCVHFTTIHTQPWQPFPERYVYQRNPVAHLFHDLERSADAAGFQPFRADAPSDELRALAAQLRAAAEHEDNGARPLPAAEPAAPPVCPEAEAGDVLRLDLASTELPHGVLAGAGPAAVSGNGAITAAAVVFCEAGLEALPDQDLPWILDALFARTTRHLHLRIDTRPMSRLLPGGTILPSRPQPRRWWEEQVELAGQRHPAIHWQLEVIDAAGKLHRREGGRRPRLPMVWVLEDDKTGHTVQSVGLAEALGWPYEQKHLQFNLLNRLSNRLLDASTLSLVAGASSPLAPPWPDLVISTGRKAAPVARWIAQQSQGHTRLVHLGRKGGEIAGDFDLVVSCAHFRMPQHRHRIETAAPLNTLTPERLATARQRWQSLFDAAPRPWVVMVVGGSTAIHELTPALAGEMTRQVRTLAQSAGGRVFAITSPRTGADATEAIAAALGDGHYLHRWQRGEVDNPYFGFLALADSIVVTGESESMLSEACSAGVPVYIYPIPERRPGIRLRLREWVTQRAYARPRKKRKGTVRPQQGLERVCAQLIARGWVRPPRDMGELHAALIRAGAAQMFAADHLPAVADLSRPRLPGLREIDDVAERVRAMFGMAGPDQAITPSREIAGDGRSVDAAR
ncbi:MAG TPA: ELM1/GtrOC1 family putative glycosyltransferase [Terriglobales bacterium]|nr:ELM1/GtrOC1 family putative glycosyltransferase [Terriglobales bacterium]